MSYTNTKNEILSKEQLMEKVPSIYASQGQHSIVSDRYNFIPTTEVVNTLGQEGWLPVFANEVNTKAVGRQGYQKHMIRFRSFNENNMEKLSVGDTFIELVLTNSHDGSAAFMFNTGLYRLACSNGMVVAQGMFQSIKIPHMHYIQKQAEQICLETVQNSPLLLSTVNQMKQITMSKDEANTFADKAKTLRFQKPELIDNDLLLRPRRGEDEQMNLWTIFGILQEGLIRGGTPYTMVDVNGKARNGSVRAIKNIDDTIRVNKGLWSMAGEFLGVQKGA